MSYNRPTARLSQRIAEEAQLLAEEKWIIDTMRKIKADRNGLQIERLHLEGMRAKAIAKKNKGTNESTPATQPADVTIAAPVEAPAEPEAQVARPLPSDDPFEHITLDIRDIETDKCYNEELNLSVTNSVFNIDRYGQACDEEDDEDEEEEEEDVDNCILDMDLLMSAK